jgi:hypothetical protein
VLRPDAFFASRVSCFKIYKIEYRIVIRESYSN